MASPAIQNITQEVPPAAAGAAPAVATSTSTSTSTATTTTTTRGKVSADVPPAEVGMSLQERRAAAGLEANYNYQTESGIVPVVQNVVATVDLGTTLDLKTIALKARNAEYNPKRFSAGVILKIREPRTTALVFATGKLVCTGAKSEEKSRLAARKFARMIQKIGFKAKFLNFRVCNIVGTCDVKFPIRLEGLAFEHNHFSSYEPELFPGLIYRMVTPKIVLMIFVSGKVVLMGGKNRKQIYDAFDNIYPVLSAFKKE